MVKICDAIMGSGKTSAAISYINAHPEKRFLYITPYLPEAKRVKNGCPDIEFFEPSSQVKEGGFTKSGHTLILIDKGANIVSTHAAMLYYTHGTIEKLKEKNYTVIIDEDLRVLENDDKIRKDDVSLLLAAGVLKECEDGAIGRGETPYYGRLNHIVRIAESRHLLFLQDTKSAHPYYWIHSPELFKELDDVIIMTYLFKDSEMEMFFKIFDIDYRYIGVHYKYGEYSFSDSPDYVPEYVKRLPEMIHIEDKERMNVIGDNSHALSISWFEKRSRDGCSKLRNNIQNYFMNRAPRFKPCQRMCGTYANTWGKIREKGYWNNNVTFNQKSSNEYRNCRVLAYPVNLFMNATVINFYRKMGYEFSNDHYALSTMVQWIWRSSIRDGSEIWIYIPSRRMRELLMNWIEVTSKGGGVVEQMVLDEE